LTYCIAGFHRSLKIGLYSIWSFLEFAYRHAIHAYLLGSWSKQLSTDGYLRDIYDGSLYKATAHLGARDIRLLMYWDGK
jgi:hypothetical protein